MVTSALDLKLWQRNVLCGALFALVMLAFAAPPAVAITTGTWEPVEGATVVQGNRVYARGIGYYTDNTIALGGATPTGDLRLVVTSSSHPVNNADGTDAGMPVFMLNSVNDTTRIEFQMRRAAFAYTAQLQQFVDDAPVDTDGDGIPDDSDDCPLDADNDIDGDGICGDVDDCPMDADNDIDGDGICGDVDDCPMDADNDIDGDGFCGDVDQCPNDPLDDVDGDGVCGDVDVCPNDTFDDSDNDGSCDSDDICPADPDNDIDNDGLCANEDFCPTDPGNDEDGDGICFADDLCPDDDTNSCVTVNGQVFGNGSTIFAANVKIGTNTVETTTNADGSFAAGVGNGEVASNGSGKFFPVKVKAPGFATGNAKVNIVPGQTEYALVVNLQQVSDTVEADDDLNEGVEINSGGNPVGSLMIPDDSLPDGVTEITGEITYLDPATNDIIAGPDLLALPAGADPNDTPVTLETFGMMEFDLQDQNGDPINELGGPAEVCMKAPAGLVEGNTVPLWYYDEDAGLWKEEGQGTVVLRNGQLQICGEVTHFTWWNYDQPINTHSCFKFQMKDASTGTPLAGFRWYAEGVTYSGTSPDRFCTDNDLNENFDSLTVKKSAAVGDPEQIRVYTLVNSIRYYLHRFGDNDYRLLQSQAGATVFDTPREQGSCLSGTRSGVCVPLDFMDATPDGMLSLSTDIDLPPVISQFTLSDTVLQLGETATAMATVTDPGSNPTDVSVMWETQCNYFGSSSGGSVFPTSGGPSNSGTTFDTVFTAPSSLSSLFASCFVDITATDAGGNSSTARRYLTVVGNFEYLFEGTLYGTDGNPLADNEVRYFNFCDGNNIDITVQTDVDGWFEIPVDLSNCGILPQEFFYGDLGSLNIPYQNGPDFWSRWMQLNNFFGYYGEFFGDFQDCGVEDDGTTRCTIDVYLPTLWSDFSGMYHRTNTDAGIGQLVDFDHNAIYGGYFANDSFLDRFDNEGPFSLPFGPSQVPLGEAVINVYEETGPGSNSFTPINDFGTLVLVPSLEPFSHDAADSPTITVPTTVKVFDDFGDPQQGFFVDSFFDVFFDIGVDEIVDAETNADGEVQFDSPLGPVEVWASEEADGSDFIGGGFARVPSVPLLIDLNSPDTCTVQGTAFDSFGEPLANSEFVVDIYNGFTGELLNVETDEFGAFSFPAFPGYLYFEGSFGGEFGFGFGQDFIDNCRSAGPDDRVIRRDLRLLDEFFFDGPQ